MNTETPTQKKLRKDEIEAIRFIKQNKDWKNNRTGVIELYAKSRMVDKIYIRDRDVAVWLISILDKFTDVSYLNPVNMLTELSPDYDWTRSAKSDVLNYWGTVSEWAISKILITEVKNIPNYEKSDFNGEQ